jgi:6-phosphogluconolactonase
MRLRQDFADDASLAEAAGSFFIASALEAIKAKGSFSVALSGGRGPLGMFRRLLQRASELDWPKLEIYWADERWVPFSHPDSNFGTARRLFLDLLPRPGPVLHPWDTSLVQPHEAALAYEAQLKQRFPPGGPFFDLCILGMGPDGHTASLFPGSLSLLEQEKLCLDVIQPSTKQGRLTLTLPVLNACASVLFLIQGTDKARLLDAVFAGHEPSKALPVARIEPTNGILRVFTSFC